MQLTLPEIKTPRGVTSKELLQDSRRGSGRALKFLRAMLAERPDVKKRFAREHQAEEENLRQRDKLQWAHIQSSKVRSASLAASDVKRNTVYTNPLGSGVIPQAPPLRRICIDEKCTSGKIRNDSGSESGGGKRVVQQRGTGNNNRSTFTVGGTDNNNKNVVGDFRYIVAAEEANVLRIQEQANQLANERRDMRLAMKRNQMMKHMKTTELW